MYIALQSAIGRSTSRASFDLRDWSSDRRTIMQNLCTTACDLSPLQRIFKHDLRLPATDYLIVKLPTTAKISCTIFLRLSTICPLT